MGFKNEKGISEAKVTLFSIFYFISAKYIFFLLCVCINSDPLLLSERKSKLERSILIFKNANSEPESCQIPPELANEPRNPQGGRETNRGGENTVLCTALWCLPTIKGLRRSRAQARSRESKAKFPYVIVREN